MQLNQRQQARQECRYAGQHNGGLGQGHYGYSGKKIRAALGPIVKVGHSVTVQLSRAVDVP